MTSDVDRLVVSHDVATLARAVNKTGRREVNPAPAPDGTPQEGVPDAQQPFYTRGCPMSGDPSLVWQLANLVVFGAAAAVVLVVGVCIGPDLWREVVAVVREVCAEKPALAVAVAPVRIRR